MLDLLLIPQYGALGAAVASTATYLLDGRPPDRLAACRVSRRASQRPCGSRASRRRCRRETPPRSALSSSRCCSAPASRTTGQASRWPPSRPRRVDAALGPTGRPRPQCHASCRLPAAPVGGLARPVGDPYADLARQLHARGVRIWWETDLVARWLEGPAAFQAGLTGSASWPRCPATAGFKVSDEIGYHDGLTIDGAGARTSCAPRTRRARAALPRAQQMLVDAVVPELGCLPLARDGQEAARQRVRAGTRPRPAAAVDELPAGRADRPARPEHRPARGRTYDKWGLTRARRRRDAWTRVDAPGLGPADHRCRRARRWPRPDGYQGIRGRRRRRRGTPTSTYRSAPARRRSTSGPGGSSTRASASACSRPT